MRLISLLLVLSFLPGCTGDPSSPAPRDVPDFDPLKVDPDVVQAMASADLLSVVVLGRAQLLEPVGGLERFELEHAVTPRQSLRADVVSRLRAVADAEQPAMLAALSESRRVRRLWIYNGIAGSLSPTEIARLSRLPSVAYVVANFGERVVFPRGDERIAQLVPEVSAPPFDPTTKPIAWNLRWLGVDRVWKELGIVGEGVTVASIDDGVNYAHLDLRSHLWRNTGETPDNGRDDDGNGYVDDVYGYDFALMSPEVRSTSLAGQHGTWTAGLIVADGASGTFAGVAPRSRLMVLRAGGHVAVAEAVQYAAAMGADVVNMSFSYRGEGARRALWRMMSDHAVAAGLALVGGAGNFQMTDVVPNQIGSPKDVPSVFVAGGVDTLLQLRPFSSTGPVEWGSVKFYGDYPLPGGLVKPDVVAFPGPGLTLLGLADAGYLNPAQIVQGNSFSGPQAAGVAALIMSADPTMAGWRARAIIESTATDIAPAGKDTRTGYGLIDAWAAVRAARWPRLLKRPEHAWRERPTHPQASPVL